MLISGPIAAGKTTAVLGLASYVRARGTLAAAIDMDELIEMMAGRDWSLIRHEDCQRARHAASALVQACFDTGMRVVIVAGSTLSKYEWDEVTRALSPMPQILKVLLRVSLEESVRRAQNDAGRVLTKNPEYVAKLAAAINWEATGQYDVEIETDDITVDQVVAIAARRLNLPP